MSAVAGGCAAGAPDTAPVSRDDPAHPEVAYRERARLAAYLASAYPAHWATPDAGDVHADDFRVVCVHTPDGQLTWHVHPGDEALFPAGMPTRPSDFDGHSTADKYQRLAALAARAAAGRQEATRDYARRLLAETRGELGRADARAVGFLGVATTAAAVVLAALLAGDWSPAVLPAAGRVLWWAGLAAALAGLGLLALAAAPGRHSRDGGGRVGYYGHVTPLAARGEHALAEALATSAAAELDVLTGQLTALAALAARNYTQIRAGVALVGAAGVLAGLAALVGGA